MTSYVRDRIVAGLLIVTIIGYAIWSRSGSAIYDLIQLAMSISERNAVQVISSEPSSVLSIETVSPRRDTQHQVVVRQPAEVEPYYLIQLFAETSGTIVSIEKEIGDEVEKGQVVAEIRPSGSQTIMAIESPIDGVIVSREVDPGTFVPNATIVPGAMPLVSIAKTDIVTVSMSVPDIFAPYVKAGMPARIKSNDATKTPWVEAKITRISPVAKTADRTIAIEIDLFNQAREDFNGLLEESQPAGFADFKSHTPPEFPLNLSGDQFAGLTPGLIHEMELCINQIGDLPLLPSDCLIRRGGKPFVFIVENGRLEQVSVIVQFDDGRYCYVRPLRTINGVPTVQDWAGTEQVVVGGEFDLQPGKRVVSTAKAQ
jgi:multidrug efflux pump subunit AcrA (membrane-fusion protein)